MTRSTDEWRQYYKEYYQKNKDKRKQYVYKTRETIRAYIHKQKDKPCTDCKIKFPYYIMQYDHLPQYTKSYDVGNMYRCGSIDTVKTELAKCELVCANCHAIRTHQRRVSSVGGSA